MFISYDIRNGIEYAKLCISKRYGKTVSKDYIYLGKVIDKAKFIFQSREKGIFIYNPIDNSYTPLKENIDQNLNITTDSQSLINKDTVDNINYTNENNDIKSMENINEVNKSNTINDDNIKNIEEKQISNNDYQDSDINDVHNNRDVISKNKMDYDASIINDLKLENILDYGDVKFIDDIFKQYKLNTLLNFDDINKLFIVIIYFSIIYSHLSIKYIQYWYNNSYINRMYSCLNINDVKVVINDLKNVSVENLNRKFYEQNNITYIPDLLIVNDYGIYDNNLIFVTDDIKRINNSVKYLLFKDINDYDILENKEKLTDFNCIISIHEDSDIYQLFIDTYILGTEKVIKCNEKFYKLGFMNVYHNDQQFYVYAFQDILQNSRETIKVIEKSVGISANLLEEALQINFEYVFMTTKEISPDKLLELITNIDISELDHKSITNCHVVDFIRDVINFILKKNNLVLQEVLFITRNQKCYVNTDDTVKIQERNSEISKIYYELDL